KVKMEINKERTARQKDFEHSRGHLFLRATSARVGRPGTVPPILKMVIYSCSPTASWQVLSRHRQSRPDEPMAKNEMLPGTLGMLILRVVQPGPLHGYAIAQRIHQLSNELLQVEEGSLYPALQRLLLKGWLFSEWGISETNRKVRFYRLTAAGRKQLQAEMD